MPEIEEEVIFETKTDQVEFKTKTNGDSVHIIGLKLTQGQAATLAWLINSNVDAVLEFEVRVKS